MNNEVRTTEPSSLDSAERTTQTVGCNCRVCSPRFTEAVFRAPEPPVENLHTAYARIQSDVMREMPDAGAPVRYDEFLRRCELWKWENRRVDMPHPIHSPAAIAAYPYGQGGRDLTRERIAFDRGRDTAKEIADQ